MMHYKKRHKSLIQSALLAICFAMGNVHGEVVIVVAADSSINSLSKSQVAKIFLGKSRRFPDGSRAVPLNQGEGNLERDAFYQQISGKSPAQIKAHRSKLIFTGRGRPPKEAANNEAVKQQLANNGLNISYIDSATVDDLVKIVAVK